MVNKPGVLLAIVVTLALVMPFAGIACKANTDLVVGQPDLDSFMEVPAIIPYINPAYYDCIQVLPFELQNAYYTAYGNVAGAETAYNQKYFVFKNLPVDLYMLREVDKGWLWADLTKCPIINIEDARELELGDRIDIVGLCGGRDTKISPGLYFKDCYVLATGTVQLPAPGGGGSISGGY